MRTYPKPDAARIATVFKCTVEQAKAQLAKNAASLLWMASRAKAKGGKYNNYTEAELRESAAAYLEASK